MVKNIRVGSKAYVKDYAFTYCLNLETVSLPYDLASMTNIGKQAFMYCRNLKAVVIPGSVTTIGSQAFFGSGIKRASFGNGSVTALDGTFGSCQNLERVALNGNVTTFAGALFANSTSLQSITVPKTVTSITGSSGNLEFYNMYGLSSIHFKRATPPSVESSNAFYNLPVSCIIYVPSGKLSAYTSASNYPSSSTYSYVEE